MEPKPIQTRCAVIDTPAATIAEGISNLRVVTSSSSTTTTTTTTSSSSSRHIHNDLKRRCPGEALVKIKSSCINYPDLLMLADGYQHKPKFPFTPGLEWSGVVLRVDPSVTNVRPGDRVVGTAKGLSSHLLVEASTLVVFPERLSFSEAASFFVGFNTAYHCLVERANVQAGEWVLVNGATGGMGMAAVLLCRHLGAHVVCTGGTEDKLNSVSKFAGIPSECCLNYRESPQFSSLVKTCTPGNRGVDVVFDPVGSLVCSLVCVYTPSPGSLAHLLHHDITVH